MKPALFTFDIFGVARDSGLDWRRGLEGALGRPVPGDEFDRFIDHQGPRASAAR